jgi:S-adenosyl-L-methionine methyltransferase
MSRLDSFIRRLTAQRDTLNHIAKDIGLPDQGAVLEIGLGNGRTYSHLRELFGDRRIVAFDRVLGAHKSSIPASQDLVLGEISETAARFVEQNAALVHVDIGTGYEDRDAETLRWLPELAVRLTGPGGVVLSGLPLLRAELEPLPLPESVQPGRLFLYRRRSDL